MPLAHPDMERLRADLIQRSRMERGGSSNEGVANANANVDIEAGRRQPSTSESRPMIAPLSRLLSRREPASMTGQPHLAEIESVKSQDSNSNRPNVGRRFAIPNFLRRWGRDSSPSQPDDIRNITASPAPLLPVAEPLSPTRPEPVATPSESQQTRGQRRRQNTSVDPLEAHLSEILDLCLSMTNKVNTREMNIMLILVILFAAAFFFHGLIRLCLLIIKGNREAALRASRPPRYRGPRYAVPPVPIPVVLARDEEAIDGDSEVTKTLPPAYGRWRETVRVDPDRLFWQRNENVDLSEIRPSTRSGPRPPSYVSEDGISYVVEAQPRSTAPSTEVPLPTHPSELGRVTRVTTE
ncbi:uncharacterized protein FIESC28_10644 [Fusarium coffeatum]|uniref:Uncharacterized protein n=1 Tax=Fusarium coffeatum TaxID=231269 RepID=A0A366QRA0_9HYPO|nr:uncharacterized protein FIESC28_10644 [Fusarium coffeatum]RBR07403.1 hypothetical protein FIESC28_10644 [Fusarium coffeatum]